MIIIRVDGSIEKITDNSLEAMQKAVGGYIEIIPAKNGQMMVINEEGKLMGLPFNRKATEFASIYGDDYIVGDVILANDDEIN